MLETALGKAKELLDEDRARVLRVARRGVVRIAHRLEVPSSSHLRKHERCSQAAQAEDRNPPSLTRIRSSLRNVENL